MTKKFLESIKWIFSGIGVLLVGFILTLIFKPSADIIMSEPPTVTNITPIEMIDSIEAAPLLQRPDVTKHYCGLRVDWSGKLYSVIVDGKRSARLLIAVATWEGSGTPRVTVVLAVDPHSYPGLSLLKSDDPIRVTGIIINIYSGIIELSDAKLISYGVSK